MTQVGRSQTHGGFPLGCMTHAQCCQGSFVNSQLTLSMDALRKLSSSRRASAREQELMTTDVSVESSSSFTRAKEQKPVTLGCPSPPTATTPLSRAGSCGHLGFLQLHDGGLAVSDAVVDVVNVGCQHLDLLSQLL